MIYAVGDIHGEYDQFMDLLEKIKFSDEDTLYVLGDVLDRGAQPIKTLQYMMKKPNIIPIVGNHELMALECLKFLMQEISEESISEIDDEIVGKLLDWQCVGGTTTTDEFHKLSIEERQDIIEYIEEFSAYEEVYAGGKYHILVHAGLGNFAADKPLWEYTIEELVWARPDFGMKYFLDAYVVIGHIPTQNIEDNPRPGYIYKVNNHIAIDCGSCFEGGRLAAYCLDTGEEFYSRE